MSANTFLQHSAKKVKTFGHIFLKNFCANFKKSRNQAFCPLTARKKFLRAAGHCFTGGDKVYL
jgi:hypothetical protein